MILTIEAATFDDPAARRPLTRIFAKVDDGWHVLRVSDLEVYRRTSWMTEQRDELILELLRASFQRAAWDQDSCPHGRALRICVAPNAECERTPSDAVAVVEEPCLIVVENRESDGKFVRRVMRALWPSMHKLFTEEGRPLRFDSPGGKGEMEKIVAQAADNKVHERCIVVVDSDRRSPTDNPSLETQRLKRKCNELGVPCWVLRKRESENYLPPELLRERKDVGREHHARLACWERLNGDQKDSYDMKDGLPAKSTQAEEALFQNIASTDRSMLQHGFGPRVGLCWDIEGVDIRQSLRDRGRGDLEVGIAILRSGI